MPHYRLTYFNAKLRAEVTRMLFKAARVEFEDRRITSEEWQTLKPTTPFGQLPQLEVDGVKLGHSQSIEMYVAREFGLAGSSSLDQARVDSYLCTIKEMVNAFIDANFEKDPSQKENKQKSAAQKAGQFLAAIEKELKGRKFIVGNKMTAADISLTTWMDGIVMSKYLEENKSSYPEILALTERIRNVPEIKAWIETRPVTNL